MLLDIVFIRIKMNVEFRILKDEDFSIYKNRLLKLYLQAFSEGEFSQFILDDAAEKDWEKYRRIGKIYVALQSDKLLGALVAYPLRFDEHLPEQNVFDVRNAVYIAELMTDIQMQGKGIGKRLMNFFDENTDKNQYTETVIRVWEKNVPALSLYRKLGFIDSGISILQNKYDTKKNGFVMKKIYLSKKNI